MVSEAQAPKFLHKHVVQIMPWPDIFPTFSAVPESLAVAVKIVLPVQRD